MNESDVFGEVVSHRTQNSTNKKTAHLVFEVRIYYACTHLIYGYLYPNTRLGFPQSLSIFASSRVRKSHSAVAVDVAADKGVNHAQS